MVLSSSQKGIIVICCDWSQNQKIKAYLLLQPVALNNWSSKNKQANRPRAKSQHDGKVAPPQQGTPLAADRNKSLLIHFQVSSFMISFIMDWLI